MQNSRLLVWMVGGWMVMSGPVSGATIINASGPNDLSLATTVLSNHLAVGFSLASTYSNVSIAATLASFGGSGDWNLSAYLTNAIGPGTTVANEVANSSTVITLSGGPLSPPYGLTTQTVFGGLTLSPGSYYLVLSGSFNTTSAFWASSLTGNGVISTSGGAAVTASSLSSGGVADPYLPASVFGGPQGGIDGFWFGVTGDLAPTVPEPATALYVLPGAALAWLLRRRLQG